MTKLYLRLGAVPTIYKPYDEVELSERKKRLQKLVEQLITEFDAPCATVNGKILNNRMQGS